MKPRQPSRTFRSGTGANSSRSTVDLTDVGDVRSGPLPHVAEVFLFRHKRRDRMSVQSLKCKECASEYELGAAYFCERCFGPLEVKYDHSDLDAATAKRRIQAGSRGIWRYADFLPFEGRPADPLEPGLTPLLKADRLAERLGVEAEIWIKNDAANPTHSFKDRVVAVAVAKAQELGFTTVACASTGNLANAVAAHAAAAGPRLLRLRPLQPGGAEAARDRGLRDQPGRRARQLRRRQPPLHAARRGVPVGVRQRQPAALLRRGLEDARLRDGRAARLGAARPRRQPDRLRLALHQTGPRLPGMAGHRPGRGRAAEVQRRPGGGLQPGRDRLRRRLGRLQAAAPGHDRQKPRDRRSGRRALRGRARAQDRRRHRHGQRPGDPRSDQAARRDHRDLHRDRGRRHDRRAAQAGRTGRAAGGRKSRRLHHRRGLEDARRDPRYVLHARDRPHPRQLRKPSSPRR